MVHGFRANNPTSARLQFYDPSGSFPFTASAADVPNAAVIQQPRAFRAALFRSAHLFRSVNRLCMETVKPTVNFRLGMVIEVSMSKWTANDRHSLFSACRTLRVAESARGRIPAALAAALLIACLTSCGQHRATEPSRPSASYVNVPKNVPAPQATPIPVYEMQRLDVEHARLDCYGDNGSAPDGAFGREELSDGYGISVGPDPKDPNNGCSASIYDSSNRVVYGTDETGPQAWAGAGPDLILDPSTGLDVDGDGSPDIVIRTGSRGNGGSSWELDVISLRPQPHVLFDFGGTFVALRKDSTGRTVLWSGEPIELAAAYGAPNAEIPVLQRAYRFSGDKLVEVTPDYCAEISKELFMPSESELQDFRSRDIGGPGYEYGEAVDVLNVIAQEIFCRQFNKALDMIDTAWPPSDRANLIQALQKESIGWNCPACQQAIASWH
jgi:hypothetical protein